MPINSPQSFRLAIKSVHLSPCRTVALHLPAFLSARLNYASSNSTVCLSVCPPRLTVFVWLPVCLTALFSAHLQLGVGIEHDVLDRSLDVLGPAGQPGYSVVMANFLPPMSSGGFWDTGIPVDTAWEVRWLWRVHSAPVTSTKTLQRKSLFLFKNHVFYIVLFN